MTSLHIIADDSRLIPYRKELNQLTGSVTASILLSQIIYWSEKNNFKPFYKFKDSPKRYEYETDEQYEERVKPYKISDSWLEELGFSRCEFDSALKKIAHKSKAKISEGDAEKFPVKPLIEYWTDIKRITYYRIVDPEALNFLLTECFAKTNTSQVKQESCFTKNEGQNSRKVENSLYKKQGTDLQESGQPTLGKVENPLYIEQESSRIKSEKLALSRIEESESTTETTTQHTNFDVDDEINSIFEKWEKTISATRKNPVKIPNSQKTPELARKADYMLELIVNNEVDINFLKNPIGFLLSDKTNPPENWEKKKPIKFVKLNDGDLVQWNGQQHKIECGGFICTEKGSLPPGRVQKLISEGEIKILAN